METIGFFRGKQISEMNRIELLNFASWAAKRLEELESYYKKTQDFRLEGIIK